MKDFVVLILCTKFEVNIIIASGIMCNTVLQRFDLNLIVTFTMVGQFANVRGSMVPTVTKFSQNVSKRPILKPL